MNDYKFVGHLGSLKSPLDLILVPFSVKKKKRKKNGASRKKNAENRDYFAMNVKEIYSVLANSFSDD